MTVVTPGIPAVAGGSVPIGRSVTALAGVSEKPWVTVLTVFVRVVVVVDVERTDIAEASDTCANAVDAKRTSARPNINNLLTPAALVAADVVVPLGQAKPLQGPLDGVAMVEVPTGTVVELVAGKEVVLVPEIADSVVSWTARVESEFVAIVTDVGNTASADVD